VLFLKNHVIWPVYDVFMDLVIFQLLRIAVFENGCIICVKRVPFDVLIYILDLVGPLNKFINVIIDKVVLENGSESLSNALGQILTSFTLLIIFSLSIEQNIIHTFHMVEVILYRILL
jgi:hypothetical protein